MAFVEVPNVTMLEAVYIQAGSYTENVFYYLAPGVATVTDIQELGAAWITEWNANMKVCIPIETSLVNVKLTDLTTAISPVVNWAATLPIAGTRSTNILPSNVTLAFTRRTALRGRSFRGRIYWPGLCESDVTQNTVASALVAQIVNALLAMNVVTTTLGNWEQVVVSRVSNGVERATGLATPVTTWGSDGIVDSMRRRLPGRGA